MNNHGKKMIAPIVVTVLMIGYFILYGFMGATFLSGIPRVFTIVIPAVFTAVMIGVCVQRIKEIRSGEEDDLGKY